MVALLGVLLSESHQQFMLVICLLWEQLFQSTSQNCTLSLGKLKLIMAVLTDDLVQKLLFSCPPPVIWRNTNGLVPLGRICTCLFLNDICEVEIQMCVSDSGAFRRQTAAETQTEVASRGFVEVCLGSLTSQLVCYCSGNLYSGDTVFNWASWPISLPRPIQTGYRPLHRAKAEQPCTRTACKTRESCPLKGRSDWACREK